MENNRNTNVRKLTLAALFAAFTCVATLLIQVPTPTKGYVNLGDCLVNISAWLLGPFYGAAAAGIGSSMADVISGYTVYAPATLVIKALMAVVSWAIYSTASRRLHTVSARIVAAAFAEVVMATGYVLFEAVIYHSFAAAAVGIPANLVQGAMGAATAVAVYELVIKRIPRITKITK
ncbi:MAG: ECF transporter S component [Ruminococcus sp.]|nr:ECF transporter S component [Ruminococcus sp.]